MSPTFRDKLLRYEAVIFDVDDTLIETYHIRRRCLIQAGKDLGYTNVDGHRIDECYGRPFDEMIECIYPGIDKEVFRTHYFRIMNENPTKLLAGAYALLQYLSSHSIQLAAITKSRNDAIRKDLHNLSIEQFFATNVWGSDDTEPYQKPHPLAFREVLDLWSRRGIHKSKILSIGDGVDDYLASRSHNIDFIAVITGRHSTEDFRQLGLPPENIIHSLEYLIV